MVTGSNVINLVTFRRSDGEGEQKPPPPPPSKPAEEGIRLKREITLFSAVNLIMGNMIGSGIFISPTSTLRRAGSVGLCLIVWAICGMMSLLGAFVYAELGAFVPKSGGEYSFFLEAFGKLHGFWGPLLAFIYVCVSVIVIHPASNAVVCLTFAEYACHPLDSILGRLEEGHQMIVRKLVALLAITLITFINSTSVKLFVRIQNVFGALKLTACGIVIAGGIYYLCLGKTEHFSSPFSGTTTSVQDIALAFYSGFWAFDGWASITVVTEEVVRPEINILRSGSIAIPLVMSIYLLMNVAYMAVLSVPEMLEAPAVAVVFGERILGVVQSIMPIGVALSTFGCLLVGQFGVTRLCYVAGREGHMLEAFSYVHMIYLTPAPAVLTQGALTCLFIIIGNIDTLIDFTGFLIWIFYGSAMVALLTLRFRKPNAYRPFKVYIFVPILLTLIAIFLAGVPLILEPSPKYLIAIVLILAAVAMYIPLIYYKKTPTKFMNKVTYLAQVILQAVPPEKELD